MKRLVLLAAILLFLIGCSTEDIQQLDQANKELKTTQKIFSEKQGSQQIYDSISEGMSMDDVRKIAGEPLKKTQMESSGTKIENWYYEGKISVMFYDGYVRSKAKY